MDRRRSPACCHGAGRSPDRIGALFQRGKQESAVAGMGLGRSISRTIVEAHGGRIWVEETPGGGATFNFTLRSVGAEELDG